MEYKRDEKKNGKLRTRRMNVGDKVADILHDIIHAVDIVAISVASAMAYQESTKMSRKQTSMIHGIHF